MPVPLVATPVRLRTYAQTADDLQVSRRTIERYARAGILTKVRLGPRTVRFRTDDIEALVDMASTDLP